MVKRGERDAYFGKRCDFDTAEVTQNIINTTKRNISYLQYKLPSRMSFNMSTLLRAQINSSLHRTHRSSNHPWVSPQIFALNTNTLTHVIKARWWCEEHFAFQIHLEYILIKYFNDIISHLNGVCLSSSRTHKLRVPFFVRHPDSIYMDIGKLATQLYIRAWQIRCGCHKNGCIFNCYVIFCI